MEDSKKGFEIKFGQDQQKDRVQLKVAAWALCKESNVASERGQNVVSFFSAEVPETGFKSEKPKPEFEAKDVKKVLSPPSKKPNVVSEKGQTLVSSLSAAAPEKNLECKELKTEFATKNVQLTRSSLCKEDVTSGKGQNVISSLGKKELKSKELKKESQTKKVPRITASIKVRNCGLGPHADQTDEMVRN